MKPEQEYKQLRKEIKSRKRYMALPADTFPGQTDYNIFKAATDAMEIRADDLQAEHTEQEFCSRCAGMTRLKLFGRVISPRNWIKEFPGMANDIGCICHPKKGRK